jgi:ABC-type branched-subunit amino acid transport system permease subunit
MHWQVSGEAVVWTVVGGAGTLLGPVFGTAGLMLVKDFSSSWNELDTELPALEKESTYIQNFKSSGLFD